MASPQDSELSGTSAPPENLPQHLPRANSFPSHLKQDISSSIGIGSSGSVDPASPTVPSTSASTSCPSSARHDSHGCTCDLFSSSSEVSSSREVNSSGYSAYSESSPVSGNSQSLQIESQENRGKPVLHGNLDIWINQASNLTKMRILHRTSRYVLSTVRRIMGYKVEGQFNHKITSGVSIIISDVVIGRTCVISNNENPVWNQHFDVPVALDTAEVNFLVKDIVGSKPIGVVAIPVEHIYSGVKVEGTYPILNNAGKPRKPGASLRLSIQYIPIEKLSIYGGGVGAGPDYDGVPGTYFPLRKGGTVTLYQDAHVPDGSLPNVKLDGGMYYVHGKCWEDIFDAIENAHRLIYITGWSLWHRVRLVRHCSYASDCTLGDLLRSKSREGVRVLLLLWKDPTSRSILGYQTVTYLQKHIMAFWLRDCSVFGSY